MIFILDKISGRLITSEIVLMTKKIQPLKKDGWSFNWKQMMNEPNTQTYVLRSINSPNVIEGALQIKVEFEMTIMDVLELAPNNVGQNKRYDYVAGCLIAFAWRESLKVEGDYKGFLTFVSKTNLIDMYANRYGAELALGQRMFINWENGKKMVEEYLERIKNN